MDLAVSDLNKIEHHRVMPMACCSTNANNDRADINSRMAMPSASINCREA
jgi:hypothetical protein